MMKTFFVAAALLVLTGCATRLPEDGGRKDLTQMEMTRWSADELELAEMERRRLEYCIRNQTGYEKIEKQFMADCELFEKKLKAEWEKPSDYAGGIHDFDSGAGDIALVYCKEKEKSSSFFEFFLEKSD